jgi:hypothetical protein
MEESVFFSGRNLIEHLRVRPWPCQAHNNRLQRTAMDRVAKARRSARRR